MQIRKQFLAFRNLIESMKLFRKEVIPSAEVLNTLDYQDEMKSLITRYLLLAEDAEFKAKINELVYLETAITQIRNINDIELIFFISKRAEDYLYVRSSFLGKGHVHQLCKGLGVLSKFPMKLRSMPFDKELMDKATIAMRLHMEDRLILEEYNAKYNGGRRETT